MKFNLARQSFFPAFFTLAALAATAVYAPHAGETAATAAASASDSVLWLPGELLQRFQAAFPQWAQALTCLLIVIAGTRAGYLPVLYNLYTANTCLAIPFFGIVACGLTAGLADLFTFVAVLLLVLSIRNFCRSYSPNYAFDAIFRGSLYLGTLVIVCPKASPLLLLLPLALIQFHRTVRELIIALAGVLLPALTLCYVNWGAGHPFLDPMIALGHEIIRGELFSVFFGRTLLSQFLGGALLFSFVLGISAFQAELYAISVKAKRILAFHIEAMLLIAVAAALPSAPTAVFALAAVPAAVIAPWFFIRTHPIVAQPAYLLLLGGALANVCLQ